MSTWSASSANGADLFNSRGVIKFVEEHICQLQFNLKRITEDGDPKFDGTPVKDYTASALIDSKRKVEQERTLKSLTLMLSIVMVGGCRE